MYPLCVQPAKLHYPTFQNKMAMNEGGGMKTALTVPKCQQAPNRFWSQYNRVHNRLGVALGPGVARERVVRSAFNPLTGKRPSNCTDFNPLTGKGPSNCTAFNPLTGKGPSNCTAFNPLTGKEPSHCTNLHSITGNVPTIAQSTLIQPTFECPANH